MRRWPGVAALLALAAVGCRESAGAGPARATRERPLVLTSIEPLAFYVRRLVGQRVDCESLAPQGVDPRHWVPDRAALARLAGADMVVLHGATLEPWLGKVALPRSRQSIVCTGWSEQLIRIENAITHTHGGEAHTHDGVDPFVWLDLDLAAKQAGVVARALRSVLPDLSPEVDRNLPALQQDLAAAAASHAGIPVPGRRLCAVEHLYEYWARRCGLTITTLDLGAGATPEATAAARAAVAGLEVRIALCSAEPSPPLRQVLDGLGLTPVVFDPCFAAVPGRDFLAVMAENRERLQRALTGK